MPAPTSTCSVLLALVAGWQFHLNHHGRWASANVSFFAFLPETGQSEDGPKSAALREQARLRAVFFARNAPVSV
jgi:hypothetical protein